VILDFGLRILDWGPAGVVKYGLRIADLATCHSPPFEAGHQLQRVAQANACRTSCATDSGTQ